MKIINLNNINYDLVKDEKEAFDLEKVTALCTDYFVDFDYVFGDYAYGKIRLKGFYESNNKKVREINNIKDLDEYIENYCAFECKYFLLKKHN